MPANLTTPRAAYQRSAVLTASQGQLIVMLYDGAHRFLTQAAVAMADRDIPLAHNKLRRAELIIEHLRGSLDFEGGGEIAPRLWSIYGFCTRHLNEARLHRDPERIQQVRTLLGTLRDAWSQIAQAA
jgi:flagellar secretion chaperone FliS